MDKQRTFFDIEQKRFERWLKFHRENPAIWKLFVRFADNARETGRRKHFGARMIGERIRWYTNVETTTQPALKVNDHFWPYYARLLMLTDDRFRDFFERRDARFDVSDEELLRRSVN